MTDKIKVRLGELEIGDLDIIRGADPMQGTALTTGGALFVLPPTLVTYPLVVSNHMADPRLLYREVKAPARDAKTTSYEINLGSILAASAVVFSTPLTASPASVSVLLLLKDTVQAQEHEERLQLILIEPARNGNVDLARPAPQEHFELLLDHAAEHVMRLAPADPEAEDVSSLVRSAMHQQAITDLMTPISDEIAKDIYFTLPFELAADEEGVFYFRDVMNGEADFLFNHQAAFDEVTVDLNVRGGWFYELEGDEEEITEEIAVEGELVLQEEQGERFDIDLPTSLTVTTSSSGLEEFFSRLAIIPSDDDGEVEVSIEVSIGEEIILPGGVLIVSFGSLTSGGDKSDKKLPIDAELGLPDDDYYEDADILNFAPDIL